MEMEFLRIGSADCPLIRLYKFHRAESRLLQRYAARLATGKLDGIELHKCAMLKAIDECELSLLAGKKDKGTTERSLLKFEWEMSRAGWETVTELIEPFLAKGATGCQWLCELGEVRIVLSPSGFW